MIRNLFPVLFILLPLACTAPEESRKVSAPAVKRQTVSDIWDISVRDVNDTINHYFALYEIVFTLKSDRHCYITYTCYDDTYGDSLIHKWYLQQLSHADMDYQYHLNTSRYYIVNWEDKCNCFHGPKGVGDNVCEPLFQSLYSVCLFNQDASFEDLVQRWRQEPVSSDTLPAKR